MSHAPGSTLKALVKLGRDPSDCWSWLGKIDANGCAVKQFDGKAIPARRWMWAQLFGPIPAGLVVTTSCGSKSCVNPHHLRLCTQAAACRATVSTTLVLGDIIEIRRAKNGGGPHMAQILGDQYGVSAHTIRDIWRLKSWNKPRPFHGSAKPARPSLRELA